MRSQIENHILSKTILHFDLMLQTASQGKLSSQAPKMNLPGRFIEIEKLAYQTLQAIVLNDELISHIREALRQVLKAIFPLPTIPPIR